MEIQQEESFNEQINNIIDIGLHKFIQISRLYVIFHWICLGLITGEMALFLVFFANWARSSTLAIILAVIFLTMFSYFVLKLYFQAKKPEQLLQLRENYINACKDVIHYQDHDSKDFSMLAHVVHAFMLCFNELEYQFYMPPECLSMMEPILEKISCWWHWRDVHRMKEILIFFSIDEHIKLIKYEPTNLEFHAALANEYVMLASLYSDPKKMEGFDQDRWIPPERCSNEMQYKFKQASEFAIEELKILNEYAPDDPWIHVQLSYNYHDLQMYKEEIHEYETILKLCPNNQDTLFKLGILYFQQGMNAKGMRVYEKLKRSNYREAESLMELYGTYTPSI